MTWPGLTWPGLRITIKWAFQTIVAWNIPISLFHKDLKINTKMFLKFPFCYRTLFFRHQLLCNNAYYKAIGMQFLYRKLIGCFIEIHNNNSLNANATLTNDFDHVLHCEWKSRMVKGLHIWFLWIPVTSAVLWLFVYISTNQF